LYEYLEGEVVRHAPARLVLAVGGVGYALSVPIGSVFPEGEPARAWTHLAVREDAHTLYGFPTEKQRDLFRLLLSVRGVGPAVALTMLSGLEVETLIEAVLAGDTSSLVRIKGVGKKTAEQILLDLRDRVGRLGVPRPDADRQPPTADEDRAERIADAVSALISIGYKDKDAEKLVARAAETEESLELETLVRAALRG